MHKKSEKYIENQENKYIEIITKKKSDNTYKIHVRTPKSIKFRPTKLKISF